MKTDTDARDDNIDARQVVCDGMYELMIAFGEIVASHGAGSQFETTRNAWFILDVRNVRPPISSVSETRAKLIQIRDGLLAANKFDWSSLCTHAIWWLSAILEDS